MLVIYLIVTTRRYTDLLSLAFLRNLKGAECVGSWILVTIFIHGCETLWT